MNYSFGDDGTIFRGNTSGNTKMPGGNPVADKMGEIRKKIHQNNPQSPKRKRSKTIISENEEPSVSSATDTLDREAVERAILQGETRESVIGIKALKDVARNTGDPKVQELLVKHPSTVVRVALARNAKLPARILGFLAYDVDDSVKHAAESHKRYHEIANYRLLDSVSQGQSINWATDISLIEDMYQANYNGRKNKYDFSGWPNEWLETFARFTSNEVVQYALCREAYTVRMALARNQKLSSSVLYKLANDNSKNVLRAFLDRTNIPKEYRKMAEDNLRQLDIQKHQKAYEEYNANKTTSYSPSIEDNSKEGVGSKIWKIILWGTAIVVVIELLSGLFT